MHVQAPSVFTASELVAGVAEHYFIAPQVQVVEKHGRQLASSVWKCIYGGVRGDEVGGRGALQVQQKKTMIGIQDVQQPTTLKKRTHRL